MPEIVEYTRTELKRLYMEAFPDAPESKARREANAEYKRRENNPGLILGLPWLRDPTPREAIRNVNREAAQRRRAQAVAS